MVLVSGCWTQSLGEAYQGEILEDVERDQVCILRGWKEVPQRRQGLDIGRHR